MGDKSDQEKRIRELEEKIRKLEEEKGKEEKKDEESEPEGVAGGILQGLGDMFGLGGIIKGLEKSPAFQEKLSAIEEEVEARLRGEPSKSVDISGGSRRSRIPGSIPGSGSIPGRTAPKRAAARRVQRVPEAKLKVAGHKEVLVDVFDEKDHVRVIAEMPGIEEKDIKLDLKGDKLVISAERADRKYHQEITLPSVSQGDPKTTYRNGILEVRIEKNPEGSSETD